MKKRSRSKRQGGSGGDLGRTEVCTGDSLIAALAEIISDTSGKRLLELRETLLSLQKQFDPNSVSMTSTNIPDAVEKLAAVVAETTEATAKVFHIVEQQQSLIERANQVLSEIESIARRGALNPNDITKLVTECRAVHEGIQASAHEVVLTQEFQDITGQKIRKVSRMVEDVDVTLRLLLTQLKLEASQTPSAGQSGKDKDIDQSEADALLKELGI